MPENNNPVPQELQNLSETKPKRKYTKKSVGTSTEITTIDESPELSSTNIEEGFVVESNEVDLDKPELTDEQKREKLIQAIKKAQLHYHTKKNFGASYKKERKRKNKEKNKSRKANRK